MSGQGAERGPRSLTQAARLGGETPIRRAVSSVVLEDVGPCRLEGLTGEGQLVLLEQLPQLPTDRLLRRVLRRPVRVHCLLHQGVDLGDDLDVEARYLQIIEAVRGRIQVPLAVKLSQHITGLSCFARRAEEAGADGLVLLTAGADGTWVVTATGEQLVPTQPITVADTIGAGDSFGGGFLAHWLLAGRTRAQLSDLALVVEATAAAQEVASITCQRVGADPPRRAELSARWNPAARPG